MKERPILFSAPMVRAILEGRKTQTRRIVSPQPPHLSPVKAYNRPNGTWCWTLETGMGDGTSNGFLCPYGFPGDRLWVRERINRTDALEPWSEYAADGLPTVADAWPWKRNSLPSIHCPRGLSRIDLEIVAIRVEKLNLISWSDAIAEGPRPCGWGRDDGGVQRNFATLWESINGPGSWDSNPYVWVVEFRRIG